MKSSQLENAQVHQAETNRRTCSVNDHQHFIRSISVDERGVDEIDRMLDEEIQIDPYAGDPPSRRSDKEIGRLLDILDSIDNSKNSKTKRGLL